MSQQEAFEQYETLSAPAKQQVIDFIASLVRQEQDRAVASRSSLKDEPLIGMWSDREDMADSTAWVHRLRESEWHRSERNHLERSN